MIMIRHTGSSHIRRYTSLMMVNMLNEYILVGLYNVMTNEYYDPWYQSHMQWMLFILPMLLRTPCNCWMTGRNSDERVHCISQKSNHIDVLGMDIASYLTSKIYCVIEIKILNSGLASYWYSDIKLNKRTAQKSTVNIQ